MRLEFLDLQGCAEAASASGYTTFALQCPDCAGGMMAVCFTGSGALLGTDQFPLKPDSECKGETWNPSAYGDTYTYNGDSFRNAVYTFSSAPPPPAPTIPGPSPSLTYVGCFQDDGSWDLPVNLEFLDLEGCAEAASAAGHTIFALQCPECGESVGTTAYCFTGYGEHLSTGVRFRVPDSECKGETWNPSAYGDTFTYNGKASRNAVYTFSSAVYTLAPSPTTPAPTTPAPTTIPGSSPSLTYVGCFEDHPDSGAGRGLEVALGGLDLEGCAEAASAAGYTIFALQCPPCAVSVGTAQCYAGSGVLLGTSVYTLRPDSEVQGRYLEPFGGMAIRSPTTGIIGGTLSTHLHPLLPPLAPTTPAPTTIPGSSPSLASLSSAVYTLAPPPTTANEADACESFSLQSCSGEVLQDPASCIVAELARNGGFVECSMLAIQDKIALVLEQQRADAGTSIAVFKSQVDVSVNNFLLQNKARITTTLESAASAAASPELLRELLEKTVSENLAGNHEFTRQMVIASFRNGVPAAELHAEIADALAGTGSKPAEAVKKLVGFATGTGASLDSQKELLVALEAEAVSKNRDILSTARAWQSGFNTRVEVVQGTIAMLIGASTGAGEEDSKTVAAAAFSRDAFKAGGLLLSGYVSQGPLRAVLIAAARSDTRIANEMKKTLSGVYGGGSALRTQFNGRKLLPKGRGSKGNAGGPNVETLKLLLDNINIDSIYHGLSGKVQNAKKNVKNSAATVDARRDSAEAAAQNARGKGIAAAGKARSNGLGEH